MLINITSHNFNIDQILEVKNNELEMINARNKELELKITLEKLLMDKINF